MVQTIDLQQYTATEINARLRALLGSGEQVLLTNPHGMHNLAINLQGELDIEVKGSTGFYTGGFMEGPTLVIDGNASWYTGDNMQGGTIVVNRNSGSNLAPTMMAGIVIVRGSAGSRIAYGLKGGTVIVGGSVGMMAGKMMLNGRVIILGNAGEQTGESMYGGKILVGGKIASLGSNVDIGTVTDEDIDHLMPIFEKWSLGADPSKFTAIVPHPGKHNYVIFRPKHKLAEVNR